MSQEQVMKEFWSIPIPMLYTTDNIYKPNCIMKLDIFKKFEESMCFQ